MARKSAPRPKHRGKSRTPKSRPAPKPSLRKAPKRAARPEPPQPPEPPEPEEPDDSPAAAAAEADDRSPAERAADDARWEATVEGQELYREGRVDAAVGALTSVLRADPRNAYAAFFLGSALHTRQNLAAARAAFETAVEVSPRFLGAQVGLGHVLLDLGDNHEAIECAKRILALRDADEDGNFLLGIASARLGRFNLAARAFEAVLRARPSLELRSEAERLLQLVTDTALGDDSGGQAAN